MHLVRLIVESATVLPTLLTYLAVVNLVLALFNMLPAFPLDGGRLLRAAIWARTGDIRRATQVSSKMGEFLGFGLIGVGILSLLHGAPLNGAWQILIGLFITSAARSSLENLRTKMILGHQTVADLMSPKVITADPGLSLHDLVNRIMLPIRVSFFTVVEQGTFLGYVDTQVLAMIDRENWHNTQVGDVFVELDADHTVAPHEPAEHLIDRMTTPAGRKLIVADGRDLVGVVTLSDLSRLLQLLMRLKTRPEAAP